MIMNRKVLMLALFASVFGLTSCDDEDTLIGPGFICDVTHPVRDLFVQPTFSEVIVHSPPLNTDMVRLTVIATNRFNQIRNDVKFDFLTSDPTIATVDQLGVVNVHRPGTAFIKVEGCGKSEIVQVNAVAAPVVP